jgi:alkylated DNA repair dioxygenase AlkB
MSNRVVAAVSYYDAKADAFIRKREIKLQSLKLGQSTTSKEWSIDLKRGGRISFYANLVSDRRCSKVRSEIDTKAQLREYEFRRFKEKRVHFLLNSKATKDVNARQPGYQYHGVKMKALPLSLMPTVESLASLFAHLFKIEDQNWGIGVDVLLYRNNRDAIGWHADDTQDESIILSVTIGSPESPRCVKIEPKTDDYKDGDERIELYPRVGDAYTMDGTYNDVNGLSAVGDLPTFHDVPF